MSSLPLDSAGDFTSNRYMSRTRRPSSRSLPFLVMTSLTAIRKPCRGERLHRIFRRPNLLCPSADNEASDAQLPALTFGSERRRGAMHPAPLHSDLRLASSQHALWNTPVMCVSRFDQRRSFEATCAYPTRMASVARSCLAQDAYPIAHPNVLFSSHDVQP